MSLSTTRVDVYDASKAHAELDSQVGKIASKNLDGYLSTRLQDYRLLLTGLGTALACLAQFYPPGKYPQNFWGLIVACPLYVVLNVVVTYWLPAQEQDIACEVVVSKGGAVTVVRSKLETDKHTYGISVKEGVFVTRKLGELFTEEGFVRVKVLGETAVFFFFFV
jgi:hypothetical protein